MVGKSIAQEEEENLRLGRHLLQIGGQEDTLQAIEAAIGTGGITATQILAQLDIRISELRDGLRGAGTRDFTTLEADIEAILARLNVNLSTRASQTTLASVLTQLDITQSALRDAIRGAGAKNFSTLETDVEGILTELAKKLDVATAGTMYSVTMTLANSEYSQALPANTKKYELKTQDGTAFRYAWVTGKVAAPTAPYWTVPAGVNQRDELIRPATLTLYFGCAVAAKIMQIKCWA